MAFYVLGDQGQKYGPADVATLNEWIVQGRIVPQTMLEDELSGGAIAAMAVPGLQFPIAAPPPGMPPAGSNYPRQGTVVNPYQQPPSYSMQATTGGVNEFRLALLMAILSPIASLLLPIGGILTSGAGVRAAFRAKDLGHPMWLLVAILNIAAIIFWLITRATGMGRGLFLR